MGGGAEDGDESTRATDGGSAKGGGGHERAREAGTAPPPADASSVEGRGDETYAGRRVPRRERGGRERRRQRRQQRDAKAAEHEQGGPAGTAGPPSTGRPPPIGRDRLWNEENIADSGEGEPSFCELRGQTDTVESFVVASSVMLSRRDRSDTLDCRLGDTGHDLDAAFTTAPISTQSGASGPEPVRSNGYYRNDPSKRPTAGELVGPT